MTVELKPSCLVAAPTFSAAPAKKLLKLFPCMCMFFCMFLIISAPHLWGTHMRALLLTKACV